MITVFYDGKCGLCRREIDHYKHIAPQDVFEWVDITIDPSMTKKIGISYADGLKLLHATDATGKLYVGIDAFLLIWRQIPRWRILAKIVSLPIIRPVANIAYRAFAAWRFNRLAHCQIANQSKEKKHD
jgi:predicted DCC family thiol-disulfide oxidoreductase YuxK